MSNRPRPEWATRPATPVEAPAIWREYCRVVGLSPDTPPPPMWSFCDNASDADTCAALVLAGRKRATAPSLRELERRREPVPEAGALDIVTNWANEPVAIIRTTRVDIVPFSEVGEDFAAAEGEGDGSLAYWRRVHRAYYERVLEGTGYVVTDDMPIVCQYFEVVYPPPR